MIGPGICMADLWDWC